MRIRCADAVAPPTDMADRHLDGVAFLGSQPSLRATATAAAGLFLFLGLYCPSCLLSPVPGAVVLMPMILSATG